MPKSFSLGGEQRDDNLLNAVKVSQVSWGISTIAEVWLFNRPFLPLLAVTCIFLALAAQGLRYLSMKALGWRWTLPIMVIPDLPVVDRGIYRYLRHPNWLGVIWEIFSLPLIHSAYLTAIFFSPHQCLDY